MAYQDAMGQTYNDNTGSPRISALSRASKQDIANFVNTGYAGASQLYDAMFHTSENNPNGVLLNPQGQDISKIWGDFQNWLTTTTKSNQDHAAYVALKQASPGRDSTVLGFNQEKQGTVLGNTNPYGKTVLG